MAIEDAGQDQRRDAKGDERLFPRGGVEEKHDRLEAMKQIAEEPDDPAGR